MSAARIVATRPKSAEPFGTAAGSAGLARASGAIFGGIFIQCVPNIADERAKSAPAAIFGVLLIGLLYPRPTGVMAGLKRSKQRRRSDAAG